MRNVIYIGEKIGVPNTAMFIHSKNMAKIFNLLGFNVIFVSCDEGKKLKHIKIDSDDYFYCGRKYSSGIKRKIESLYELITGTSLYNCFIDVATDYEPSLVVYYGYAAEKHLLKYTRKHRVPLIIERVDWFERSDRSRLFQKVIEQCIVDHAYNFLDLRADGILAISDFIQDYFISNNMKVIKIPPIFESVYKNIIPFHTGKPIELVYCGNLGNNKDYIFPIIDSLKFCNKDNLNFIFHIIGISKEQLSNYYAIENINKYGVIVHGSLDNIEARKIIRNCDFSFLLREKKRYSVAGFSTKFAESMILGVPVICNKVGGADAVLTDRLNGILIDGHDTTTIINTLLEILNYNEQTINSLKQNALDFANEYFNFESYAELMKQFVMSLETH